MSRRYRIRSVFTLFLVSYIMVLIVPACLAGYLYHQAMTMSREKYIESEQGRLSRSIAYFERYLEQLDSTVLKLSYDRDLQQILQMEKPEPGDTEVIRVVRFNERVRDLLSAGQDSSYALILKDNEFVFTNTSVIYGLSFFYEESRNYENMTASKWIQESFSSSSRDFLPMQPILWMNESVNALTYNHPVYGYERKIVGTVQYLVTEEQLVSLFREPLEDQGQVCLYSQDGQLLATLGQDIGTDHAVDGMETDRGYVETDDTVTLYQRSEEGLLFTLSRPDNVAFADAYALGKTGWISAALCVILELGLGIFFAWRYSRPLQNILMNLRQMFGTGEDRRQNEYRQLTSGVQRLIQSNYHMQDALRDQKERERRSVIDQLLKGQMTDEQEIREALDRVGVMPGQGKRGILVWEMQEEAVMEKIQKIDGICWVYDELPGRYVLMVETEQGMEEVKQRVEETNIGTAGIGRDYDRLPDLALSYQQAMYSLRQAQVQGQCVLRYADLSSRNQEIYYPEELKNKLIQGVCHGGVKIVEEVFYTLYKENVEKRFLAGGLCRILQANLAETYLRVQQEWRFNRQSTPEQLMEPFESAMDMLQKMRPHFLELCGEMGQMQQHQKSEDAKRLIEYLENHFQDTQMGVGMMAEIFGFSESYFSGFFRETTGESFSGCLERIRMDHAKQYLRQKDVEVEDIAHRCGYTNAASFRRAFKRVHGVSPSVWKKENP